VSRIWTLARKDLLDAVDALGKEVRANTALAERIRRKYKIKNTTGFSLNALVDFEDPFDILSDPEVAHALDRAFARGAESRSLAESSSARN
jgi:D-lactate dehydrogenase